MTVSKVQELAAKRIMLAKYSREDLEKWNKAALRKEAKGIVSGLNKASKEEIIEGILAATQAERQLAIIILDLSKEDKAADRIIAENRNEITQTDIGTFSEKLYKELYETVQKCWDEKKEVWKEGYGLELTSLGYRITSYLDGYRTSPNNERLANSTQLRYRVLILNTVREMIDLKKGSAYYVQLSSAFEMMERACKIQMRDKADEKAENLRSSLAERKATKEKIVFPPMLEYAHDILNRLDTLSSFRWYEVSIALAITTGRRLAEIHSTGIFEESSPNEVIFTGQLKARGLAEEWYKKNPSYLIPTLVPSHLVVKGVQWLVDKNKRVDDPEKAHKRYSKDLSSALKEEKLKMNINSDRVTFKMLRTIYAQVCSECFNPSDKTQYLAKILGHGRGDHKAATSGNFSDFLTPQSYDADFNVIGATYIPG